VNFPNGIFIIERRTNRTPPVLAACRPLSIIVVNHLVKVKTIAEAVRIVHEASARSQWLRVP
jgi:hypothetical protein